MYLDPESVNIKTHLEPGLREVRVGLRGGQDRPAGAALPLGGEAGAAGRPHGAEDEDTAGSQGHHRQRPKHERLHTLMIWALNVCQA